MSAHDSGIEGIFCPDQIAICIHTSLPPRDALARLREFDEDWWLDNLSRARGLVTIDVAPS